MESQPSKSGRSPSRSNSDANVAVTTPTSASAATSQSLSSILNNPNASESTSWINWWPASASLTGAVAASSPPEFLPISSAKAASDVSRSDLQAYVASISEPYHRFEDVLNHASKEAETTAAAAGVNLDGIGGQGEALVACLREVPSLFFKEDFALEDGATFRSACPFSNVSENVALQEKLTHYLDVVELHLVKEISLRSDSFFEAQVKLQGLDSQIVEGVARVRGLRETIRLLDADLVGPAEDIRRRNKKRSNLVAIQQKLALILNVNQALAALKLLVAAADCAGALDITDDLQHLLEGDELTGLHCFRHLRDHVGMSIESINSILSAEFLRASVHDAGDTDTVILSKAKARASITANGKNDDVQVKLDKEETSSFRDRLLPIIIGLLRTAKLPAVLRLYRDTLTADMKTAIKNSVAELLPVLVSRPLESEIVPGERTVDADGASASLASKLRSLSSESFVQLLDVIFTIVRAHLERAAEVKKAIEWIMSSLDGHYAADSVAAAIAVGAAAAEIADVQDGLVPFSQKSIPKVPSFQGKGNDAASSSNMSKNFRADVLRENTEAVFAACDASHGRWAKLLGVRALLHPKLRLQEFLSIYSITQDFITATEKIGGRLGYSIRGTLQSQAKAFVDFQHETRMTKIRAVLDQETWVEVDVPEEFQTIVTSLFFCEALASENHDDAQDVIVEEKSAPLAEAVQKKKDDVNSVAQTSQNNIKERGKSLSQTLMYNNVGYHMVNCGLILLKMLSEYIDMNNSLPTLSSEIVHRVVEILKFFNTRTCQLVLGAGAMQVSGLKSITSKHLALASQVISFIYAIIPEIRRILFLKVPDARKAMLLSEIDRVAQDYKVHRDEIHTKLVQIMRERLLVHLRSLPQIVEGWNRPEDTDPQPSQFARSLTKEVGFLQRVLSRTLHDIDVQTIFRQVVVIFHTQISETFSRMEINTPEAADRLHRDITHVLACIRSLPTNNVNESGTPNWGQLDEFLAHRFGGETG